MLTLSAFWFLFYFAAQAQSNSCSQSCLFICIKHWCSYQNLDIQFLLCKLFGFTKESASNNIHIYLLLSSSVLDLNLCQCKYGSIIYGQCGCRCGSRSGSRSMVYCRWPKMVQNSHKKFNLLRPLLQASNLCQYSCKKSWRWCGWHERRNPGVYWWKSWDPWFGNVPTHLNISHKYESSYSK